MTPVDDLKLILEIIQHGGHKYTAGNIDRTRYRRLVDLGWLLPVVENKADIYYVVTREGLAAAS